MTRKDFQLIANALLASKPRQEACAEYDDELRRWEITVVCMAASLATTNSRFDRPKFVTACGL
jgi:hypothetical protein